MVNSDLIENKTEMMLNGDLMFKLQKKVATVLSPPTELAGKQTSPSKNEVVDPTKIHMKVEEAAA
jgi:hypothetical protein